MKKAEILGILLISTGLFLWGGCAQTKRLMACQEWETQSYFDGKSLQYREVCVEDQASIDARIEGWKRDKREKKREKNEHKEYLESKVGKLHEAVYQGKLELVKKLVSEGTDVNIKYEKYGSTALHVASARYDRIAAAELLISIGADVNARNDDGWTPIYGAIRYGSAAIVKLLISKGADVNAKEDRGGHTPLHIAARLGKTAVAELLISKGADVNARDDDGSTPFDRTNSTVYEENSRARKAVAELLISKGADINLNIKDGSNLKQAIQRGDSITAEILIEKGADVNVKEKDGSNLLHYFIEKGVRNRHWKRLRNEMARLLIDKGVDVNARNKAGHTPLSMAIKQRDTNLSDFLRQHGAQ